MNIIQIQDRLKGLPNEALVNYVEQPMGEVPIYLALGELQRRKGMRERFQASQTPPPSVSEQVVAEAKPQQMGLGAMAPQGMMPPTEGVGAPQPQPQMDPRQLAASGIAANPQSAVGGPAMMAGGGIVGYGKGDLIKKGTGGLKKLYDKLFGKGKTTKDAKDVVKKGFIRNHPYWATGIGGTGAYAAYPYMFGGEGDDTTSGLGLTDEEKYQAYLLEQGGKPKEEQPKELPKLTEDEKVLSTLDRIKGLLPTDKLRESLAAKLEGKEKSNLNMAAIMAGLTMAGGKSPNFLENLTAGATAGLGSYTDTAADIFETEADLAKTQRAEDIALMGQALDMGEKEKDREVKRFVADVQGPLVAKHASDIEKMQKIARERYFQFQRAYFRALEENNGVENETTKKYKADMQISKAEMDQVEQWGKRIRGLGTGQTIESTQAGSADQVYNVPF